MNIKVICMIGDVPFIDVPEFKDWNEASEYDRRVFEAKPDWDYFVRRAPEGQAQFGASPNGRGEYDVFNLVQRTCPGVRLKIILSCSKGHSLGTRGLTSVINAAKDQLRVMGADFMARIRSLDLPCGHHDPIPWNWKNLSTQWRTIQ